MLDSAIAIVGLFALAALFGGIAFFPSVVAPVVFKVLDADAAGRFLRALFPAYYLFMIVTSIVAAVAFYAQPFIALGLLLIAISTGLIRQILVPQINAWRDQELAGGKDAAKKFAIGHRASVIINLIQLLGVIAILAMIALD